MNYVYFLFNFISFYFIINKIKKNDAFYIIICKTKHQTNTHTLQLTLTKMFIYKLINNVLSSNIYKRISLNILLMTLIDYLFKKSFPKFYYEHCAYFPKDYYFNFMDFITFDKTHIIYYYVLFIIVFNFSVNIFLETCVFESKNNDDNKKKD